MKKNSKKQLRTQELEDWVRDIGLGPVLRSDAVQRLKGIRHLGTMEYVTKLKVSYSRYEHSLSVAKLASVFAARVGLSDETNRLLTIMGLLHDVGHMPFSHASEVYLFKYMKTYYIGSIYDPIFNH